MIPLSYQDPNAEPISWSPEAMNSEVLLQAGPGFARSLGVRALYYLPLCSQNIFEMSP